MIKIYTKTYCIKTIKYFCTFIIHTCTRLSIFSQLLQLTHWGRDKMAAIFQTIFWNAFSCMKSVEFGLTFHWSVLLRIRLMIFQHWFRQWLGTNQVTLSEPMIAYVADTYLRYSASMSSTKINKKFQQIVKNTFGPNYESNQIRLK